MLIHLKAHEIFHLQRMRVISHRPSADQTAGNITMQKDKCPDRLSYGKCDP